MKFETSTSFIEHEATVSKINEDQLFYLMSRGLSEKDATQMIVMGFIEPFSKELTDGIRGRTQSAHQNGYERIDWITL
jgi:Fe-S cluster assembly scaffold protein SufB